MVILTVRASQPQEEHFHTPMRDMERPGRNSAVRLCTLPPEARARPLSSTGLHTPAGSAEKEPQSLTYWDTLHWQLCLGHWTLLWHRNTGVCVCVRERERDSQHSLYNYFGLNFYPISQQSTTQCFWNVKGRAGRHAEVDVLKFKPGTRNWLRGDLSDFERATSFINLTFI